MKKYTQEKKKEKEKRTTKMTTFGKRTDNKYYIESETAEKKNETKQLIFRTLNRKVAQKKIFTKQET